MLASNATCPVSEKPARICNCSSAASTAKTKAASHGRIGYKIAAGTLREQSLLLSF
jgi:hypothetical protein